VLFRSGDDKLAKLVPLAAKGDAAPADVGLELGDWYFQLSQGSLPDAVKERLLVRSSHSLAQFISGAVNATGIQKATATLTLNRVKAAIQKLKPVEVAVTAGVKPGVKTPSKTVIVTKPGKKIDLFKLVDPSQDAATGKWEKSGRKIGVMVEGTDRESWINLPVQPDGEYDIRFTFARTVGRAVVKVYLPITFTKGASSRYPAAVSATFGAYEGKISMLEQGSGYTYYYSYYYSSRYENNPTVTRALRFSNGKSYKIRITVKNEKDLPRVTVYVGGKKFISWRGKPTSLPGYSYSSSSGQNLRAIGFAIYNPVNRSSAVFNSCTLQMLSGTAKQLHE